MSPSDVDSLVSHVAAAALHVARLVPVAMMCPFLGGPAVPSAVRAALATALGCCAWSAAGAPPAAERGATLVALAVREVGLGAVLGFLAALPFEAARAGGRLVDTLRGATLSELHVAPLRQRESASGDLLSHWTVALAASSGGDRLIVGALLETFRAVPAGSPARGPAALEAVLTGGGELLACAVCIGAPAAVGVIAADLAVGAAARISPQLGITGATQPARAAAGLLALAMPAALIGGRLTALVATSAGLIVASARGGP